MNKLLSITNGWLLLLIVGAAMGQDTAAPQTPATSRHTLTFQNGDVLIGKLDSITPENGIRWQHQDVAEPIGFSPNNVTQIHLGKSRAPAFAANDACGIRLRNGDELEGNLVFMDAREVKVSTWYAGDITIPREHVELISPLPLQLPVVYSGFSNLEGWTVGKVTAPVGADPGEWKFADGAIFANESASIARDLKLPGMASIEFDLAWRGTLNIALALYTDSLQPVSLRTKETEPKFGAFYSLQINSFSLNLLAINQQDPLRSLGSAVIPAFNQKNTTKLAIRVNRDRRSIMLFADGILMKEWIDAERFSGEGTGVRIVHQGQGSVRISGFSVSEWDGRVEAKPPPRKDSKDDVALLMNGDQLRGALHTVKDSKASFTMGARTIEIPLQRIMYLDLAGPTPSKLMLPDATYAHFTRGGALTLKLERWEKDRIIASSPLLKQLSLDPRAFTRIVFKPFPNNLPQ